MNFVQALTGSVAALANLATGTISFREPAAAFWEVAREQATVETLARVGVAAGLAGWASVWVTRRGLIPRSNTWHVSGAQLLQGKEALAEARRRSLTKKEQADELHALSLHPDWVVSKRLLARHMFIYGSVGSGKSVILRHMMEQVVRLDKKAFIYDIKGDFTSIFRRPAIVCPFDKRSWIWDVGRDVATQTQAAAFSQSIIPSEEGSSGAFWASAAQALLEGCVRELQATKGKGWGWEELAVLVARPAEPMFQALSLYYPRAAALISNPDSNTTSSCMAVLANGTAVIERLALAWPERKPDRMFSMLDWIKDDYAGRKQVIVQSGPDEVLTKAYISAIINVAVPEIIGPSLPDDEAGRFLGFFFDELTSAGKLNIEPLLALGRSKGVVSCMAVQDWSQVEKVYGDKTAQALLSMIGSQVICQTGGETREKISRNLGKRRVAWMHHGDKATVHEESKAIVSPGRLTDDLGFRKGKSYGKERWGIRAIVQTTGDLLLLDWPGISYPKVREGQKRARWTKQGAQPVQKRRLPETSAQSVAEVQRVLKMTADQASAELQKRGATPPKLRAVSDAELEAIFRK
jgi:hypothetical protein